jgi:hypothetical protein
VKSYYRYHNLFWHAAIDNEKFIDKIEINGNPIYVKIRNELEKSKLFKLKEIAVTNGINVSEEQTDFSYKLFGLEMKI